MNRKLKGKKKILTEDFTECSHTAASLKKGRPRAGFSHPRCHAKDLKIDVFMPVHSIKLERYKLNLAFVGAFKMWGPYARANCAHP